MQRPTIERTTTMDRETKQALLTAADMQGLSAEFWEVLADAERYRWVKRVRPGALLTVAWGESKFACAIADDPDAAIDAAMADAPAVGAA